MLKIGDSVGGLYPYIRNGIEVWELTEDKITKITISKNGRKYHVKSKFRTLCADDVDSNTEIFEEIDCVFTREVFGLTDKNRRKAEYWVKWVNEDLSRVQSIFEAKIIF